MISEFFSSEPFLPHGHCYLWDAGLLWFHIISDGLIALAYSTIPFTLVYFIRKRRDLPFNWMFFCFAVFIIACGATHVMEILVIWHPVYWLSGAVKAITAMASVPTAILLVRLIPKALAIPSPAALSKSNVALEQEVAERKRVERALHEKNVELLNAAEAKNRFLANMSHELRTPLNGIIGFSELIADGKPGPLNSKQQEYVGDVHASALHLLQLINDVLDLAKIEAGKVDLNPELFSVERAINEVCAIAKAIAQRKRITIGVHVALGLESVRLDQQKFKQVLFNLLSNAVKFTDEGGKVEIRVAPDGGDRFRLQVADTGIGIKRDDFIRLFREFEQLDSGAARHYEGTGLGLALTKKLVEAQQGEISVESEIGKGSTFSIVLPRAGAKPQTVPTS
jgi:signal transduction histidine kinase